MIEREHTEIEMQRKTRAAIQEKVPVEKKMWLPILIEGQGVVPQ